MTKEQKSLARLLIKDSVEFLSDLSFGLLRFLIAPFFGCFLGMGVHSILVAELHDPYVMFAMYVIVSPLLCVYTLRVVAFIIEGK